MLPCFRGAAGRLVVLLVRHSLHEQTTDHQQGIGAAKATEQNDGQVVAERIAAATGHGRQPHAAPLQLGVVQRQVAPFRAGMSLEIRTRTEFEMESQVSVLRF